MILWFLFILPCVSWTPQITKLRVPPEGTVQYISVKNKDTLFGYYHADWKQLLVTKKKHKTFSTKAWNLNIPEEFIMDVDFEVWNHEIHHIVTCYDKKDDLNRVYLNNRRFFYSKSLILKSMLLKIRNSLLSIVICRNGELNIYNQTLNVESFHSFNVNHSIFQIQQESDLLYLLDSFGTMSIFSLEKLEIIYRLSINITQPIHSFHVYHSSPDTFDFIFSYLDKNFQLVRINLSTKEQELLFQKKLTSMPLKVYNDKYKFMVACENESVLCFDNDGMLYFHLKNIFNRNYFHQWYVSNKYMVLDGVQEGLVIYEIPSPKLESNTTLKYSYLKHTMTIPEFNTDQLKSNWSFPVTDSKNKTTGS